MEKTTVTTAPYQPKLVYETPNFKVTVGLLSGPAETPQELRVRFVVQDKKYGVIYGTAGSTGAAIVAALTAEAELQNAAEIAAAQEARGFKPVKENGVGGPPIPSFQ